MSACFVDFSPKRIAIVGTRDPEDEQIARVFAIVAATPPGTIIVSGGARGIDTWAALAAQFIGRELEEHLPEKYTEQGMAYKPACFKRNGDIIDAADHVHALPGPEWRDGRGGTLDSMKKSKAKWGEDTRHHLTIWHEYGQQEWPK